VVVTWANYHYRDFVMNWVEHLAAAGCNAYIVGTRHRIGTYAAFSCLLSRLCGLPLEPQGQWMKSCSIFCLTRASRPST
jgi:hypothetical protein